MIPICFHLCLCVQTYGSPIYCNIPSGPSYVQTSSLTTFNSVQENIERTYYVIMQAHICITIYPKDLVITWPQ